ncbi:MAG: hypothetical protein JKX70_03560 [Phycisphaerales bacterium]|nr:hypothetical protein [Phycisphaerales bacterium]
MTSTTLSIPRSGLALGGTLASLYAGCVFVMYTVPRETVIEFTNSILHGLNIETIIRWDMPMWEAGIGIIEIFILGWLFGALFAFLYNIGAKPSA